jgi:hypothetical protein
LGSVDDADVVGSGTAVVGGTAAALVVGGVASVVVVGALVLVLVLVLPAEAAVLVEFPPLFPKTIVTPKSTTMTPTKIIHHFLASPSPTADSGGGVDGKFELFMV